MKFIGLVDRYVYRVKLHLYKIKLTIELFLKTFEVMFNWNVYIVIVLYLLESYIHYLFLYLLCYIL